MVFSDLFFLFVFIPAFALCYMLGGLFDRWIARGQAVKSHHVKNAMLVVFSLIFYAWGEPMYVFLMLVSVLLNYVAGRIIDGQQRHRRKALVGGLVCNLLILATFKYAGFFAEALNSLGLAIPVPHIALPIGISFYTFQSISYLVDVYRRESPAQRRFADLLLYISMFPQLIAGPIVRYGTIAEEINNRHVTASDLSDGIYRFLIGLGKKVILANQFSEIVDQFLVDGLGSLTTSGAWIGITAFTLQIYFDFSGYSDMARGLGRMLGFEFCINFNYPYISQSVTEFWRRWHISLSSWFRDYVYIPLGGNRCSKVRNCFNILVVWALTGFWHGAGWNFLFWGFYYGVLLLIEKLVLGKYIKRWPKALQWLYAMVIVVIGWVFFASPDLSSALAYLGVMFSGAPGDGTVVLLPWLGLAVIGAVAATPLGKTLWEKYRDRNWMPLAEGVLTLAALLLCVGSLVSDSYNPFLYFRF